MLAIQAPSGTQLEVPVPEDVIVSSLGCTLFAVHRIFLEASCWLLIIFSVYDMQHVLFRLQMHFQIKTKQSKWS